MNRRNQSYSTSLKKHPEVLPGKYLRLAPRAESRCTMQLNNDHTNNQELTDRAREAQRLIVVHQYVFV